MCGIAGLIELNGLCNAAESRARSAREHLRRRGPDGEGIWTDGCCALVHTRLAVIDLSSGGAQPMQRDSLVITFNGEIFNYAEIRSELAGLGHSFRSNSDTEVILAGWRQWSAGLLPRLVGMFAFAIWDTATQTLFAARDRFGEKPLLYAASPSRFAFGSDLQSCETMLGETRPIDPAALRAYFTLRFIPEPWSIAAGIHKLPAGHWLRFNQQGTKLERWYDLPASRATRPTDPAEAEAQLRQRFDAAVAARLVSDVPVGVFLSSGIDSAAVAASVARSGQKLKTFTVGFEGAPAYYEERPAAAQVARHLGAEHHEISVNFNRAADVLDDVFFGLDEPFADASAVPTFLVSEATRRQVTVVLTGDGADEVFAGYRRYWAELYQAYWNRVPAGLRQSFGALLSRLPEDKGRPLLERLRRLRRFVETAHADPAERQAAWMRMISEREADALLGPAPSHSIRPEGLIMALRQSARDPDLVNAMLTADVLLELPSDMLVKVDRMSMAHALETRTPFLDQRVVEWGFGLAGSDKLALEGVRPKSKRILRSAFRDRLPAGVFRRPKRGFEMPVGALLASAAAERLRASTDPAALMRQGILNPDVVQRWRRELQGGFRDSAWQLWAVMAFQEWARLHRRPEAIT
jgi:asparagine synthase (glutamine-hydrolysing)